MKTTAHVSARAATAADITPDWVAAVASAIARDHLGHDITPDDRSIIIRSKTGQWMALNLPTNSPHFADATTARATYSAIVAALKST